MGGHFSLSRKRDATLSQPGIVVLNNEDGRHKERKKKRKGLVYIFLVGGHDDAPSHTALPKKEFSLFIFFFFFFFSFVKNFFRFFLAKSQRERVECRKRKRTTLFNYFSLYNFRKSKRKRCVVYHFAFKMARRCELKNGRKGKKNAHQRTRSFAA